MWDLALVKACVLVLVLVLMLVFIKEGLALVSIAAEVVLLFDTIGEECFCFVRGWVAGALAAVYFCLYQFIGIIPPVRPNLTFFQQRNTY